MNVMVQLEFELAYFAKQQKYQEIIYIYISQKKLTVATRVMQISSNELSTRSSFA